MAIPHCCYVWRKKSMWSNQSIYNLFHSKFVRAVIYPKFVSPAVYIEVSWWQCCWWEGIAWAGDVTSTYMADQDIVAAVELVTVIVSSEPLINPAASLPLPCQSSAALVNDARKLVDDVRPLQTCGGTDAPTRSWVLVPVLGLWTWCWPPSWPSTFCRCSNACWRTADSHRSHPVVEDL